MPPLVNKMLVPMLLSGSWAVSGAAALPLTYSVAVIGDQPYGGFFEPATTLLLEAIDRDEQVSFVLHTGDIKGGGEPCSNELLIKRINQIQASQKALVYAVGDNEWTDCHRVSNGSHSPQERLDFLRKTAYANPARTLGKNGFAISHQGDKGFPEHQMFHVANTLFVVLNVPGSNNNLSTPSSRKETETEVIRLFEKRHEAIDQWLNRAEEFIKSSQMTEAVMVIQGNPIDGSGQRGSISRLWQSKDGYERFMKRLIQFMKKTKVPTLLVHGDTHSHKWDKPDLSRFSEEFDAVKEHFYRLENYGHPNLNTYVRLTISTGADKPFSIESVRVNYE
jgi:hypothetical protein